MVNDVRSDLAGGGDDLQLICRRAWTAFELAQKHVGEGVFGSRSFQYVALGLFLSTIQDLEEDGEGAERRLKRKNDVDSESNPKRPKLTSTSAQRDLDSDVEVDFDMESDLE